MRAISSTLAARTSGVEPMVAATATNVENRNINQRLNLGIASSP
jgi:hypothetical protein